MEAIAPKRVRGDAILLYSLPFSFEKLSNGNDYVLFVTVNEKNGGELAQLDVN